MNRGSGHPNGSRHSEPCCFNEAPIHESGKSWVPVDALNALQALQ